MALQYKIDTLEGVDESVQSLYKEADGGGYQLDVDGVAPKEKVKEFRDNNIELTQKMTAIEDRLQGLDVDQFNQMFQTVQKMAQSESDTEMTQAIEGGAEAVQALIESRAAQRAEAMKADLQHKLDETTSAGDNYREQLEEAKITAELTRLAAEKGVRTTAVDDVLLRGKQIFKLSDQGDVVALKDGNIVYNKDNQPLTINEYISELSETAPHLFEQSTGGGSDNSVRTNAGKKGATFTYRGKEHKYV